MNAVLLDYVSQIQDALTDVQAKLREMVAAEAPDISHKQQCDAMGCLNVAYRQIGLVEHIIQYGHMPQD